MTCLYLIRHGEAFCNVEPVIGGMRGDAGLTPRGIHQAERLRDRLAATREIKADVLIASTLPRARQTAEIIAPALGLPIIWDDEVQEMRPGEADGLSIDAFHRAFGLPDEHQPFRPMAPGGESWPQFMLRVARALDRIARDHAGKTIVVVCHGGVIDGSFFYFFGTPTLGRPTVGFDTHNTSITAWRHGGEPGRPPRWRLLCYNDDRHLREALSPQQPGERPAVPVASEEKKGHHD